MNPKRNILLDRERAHILAAGCIGYTSLMCGRPSEALVLNSACFLSRQRAEKEMQTWKEEKKCCGKRTDNEEAAEPRLYSIHTFKNYYTVTRDGRILKLTVASLAEFGSYDFGYVEDDGSITSGDHGNRVNNPTTFFRWTPEEWAEQVDPTKSDKYSVELWCVTCNDNLISINREEREISNIVE